jgi:hypothetical protein
MKFERVSLGEQSFWQLIFSQSKVNGAPYEGEKLIPSRWHWPTNTYLQRRRQLLKNSQVFEAPVDNEARSVFYDAMYDQSSQGFPEYTQSSVRLRSN